jgi:hypothetical protein
MSIFKNKLHFLIDGQLPEYITVEFPLFTTFLKKYYEFLETENSPNDLLLNSDSWQDIDLTLQIFLPEFKKQYAGDISDEVLLSARRIVKYIHQYYEAKGSENATELFFRFMYNEKATVAYPGDYILRASDGKWSRKRILKLDTSAFSFENPYELKGKRILLNYLQFIPGEGTKLQSIEMSCFNIVRQIDENIYQLEVDIDPKYIFPANIAPVTNFDINGDGGLETITSFGDYDSHVYVINKQTKTIYGSLSSQVISLKSIDTAGSNFRVDDSYLFGQFGTEGEYFAQQYMVDNDDYVFTTFDNNAIIRITETTKLLQLPQAYTFDVAPYFAEDYVDTGFSRKGGGISQLQIVDTGQRFLVRDSESIVVSYFEKNDDPEDNYVGEVPNYDSDDYASDLQEKDVVNTLTINIIPKAPRNSTGQPATLTFNTGLIYHAQGAFKDSSGFLSDINYLQDNYYYQPYSYVIRTQHPQYVWKELYERSNHPAGFKLFSELQFIDNVSISATIVDKLNVISFKLNDIVIVDDNVGNKTLFKIVTELYFDEDYVEFGYIDTNSMQLSDEITTINT